LAALKNETALAKVRGVVADLAEVVVGAPDVMKLPLNRHRQIKENVLRI